MANSLLPSKNKMIMILSQHLTGLIDRGRWISWRCPYHEDHNPSFGVDTEKGAFNCFACHATGTFDQLLVHLGIESDLQEVDAMSDGEWKDVMLSLDNKSNRKVKWPGEDLEIISPYAEEAPRKYASYLERARKLPTHTIISHKIGWSPREDNRVLIPVWSLSGDRVLWIERRRIDNGKPKYWRPKGVRKELALYGMSSIAGYNWIVIVEGIFDTIALSSYNIPSVCCFGGFSTFHRNAIAKRFDMVYVCFDGDDAGRRKAKEAIAMLKDCGLYVKNVKLPEGQDPGSYAGEIARKMGSDWSVK